MPLHIYQFTLMHGIYMHRVVGLCSMKKGYGHRSMHLWGWKFWVLPLFGAPPSLTGTLHPLKLGDNR